MQTRYLPFALLLLHAAAFAEPEDAIAPDRPDFVDSSATVAPGVLQVEAGLGWLRNRDGGVRERASSTPLLLRLGVADGLELRVDTDGRQRYRADGPSTVRERGYGDTGFSFKWHVADQQGAMPALGLIGQLDFDTGSAAFRGEGVRPSLRVPIEWDLPAEWSLGVMPGLVRDRNDNHEHVTNGMFGVTLGKSWTERFSTFVELAAPRIARARNGGSLATFDIGGGYLLSKDWMLDAAFSRGLNRHTPDRVFTIGLSTRL